MSMMAEADGIVRHLVPVVLEAAGRPVAASALRSVAPVYDLASMSSALTAMRVAVVSGQPDPTWDAVLSDCLFWAEDAMAATLRDDVTTFKSSIVRIWAALSRSREVLH